MRREIVVGIVLAIATYAVLILLPLERGREAIAILLAFIAAVYVGFALASRGAVSFPVQALGASFFVICSFLGLWIDWWFLVVGLLLHGVWDFMHHGKLGHGVLPYWYVPFCAAYDWTMAVLVAVLLLSR